MTKASVDTFDTTQQKTDLWLKNLMEKMNWESRHNAYVALRAVLHALRDRLPIETVAKFGAQLPMLIRGFYYEGWVPSSTPVKVHSKEDFLAMVYDCLGGSKLAEDDIEKMVINVFRLLREQLELGEIEHIKAVLPRHIAALWEV